MGRYSGEIYQFCGKKADADAKLKFWFCAAKTLDINFLKRDRCFFSFPSSESLLGIFLCSAFVANTPHARGGQNATTRRWERAGTRGFSFFSFLLRLSFSLLVCCVMFFFLGKNECLSRGPAEWNFTSTTTTTTTTSSSLSLLLSLSLRPALLVFLFQINWPRFFQTTPTVALSFRRRRRIKQRRREKQQQQQQQRVRSLERRAPPRRFNRLRI